MIRKILWRPALRQIAFIALILLNPQICVLVAGSENWTRDLIQDGTNPDAWRRHPFYVSVTDSTDGRLCALCVYLGDVRTGPIVLHGRMNSSQRFSPVISYQVGIGTKENWREIARSHRSGDTLTITDTTPVARLNVDMEPFRDFIGRSRWGRVVLENGKAAVVDLDDLLPPCNVVPQGGDCKEVFNVRHPILGSAAFLHSAIWLRKHVIGVFVDMRENESAVKGSTNREGDFSPSAEFYAGNGDKQWMPIGVSTPLERPALIRLSTKPAVFRIDLDAYKSAVTRFEFGKAVFSDGSFAIFRLCQLAADCDD
jgi:hypothetical protein